MKKFKEFNKHDINKKISLLEKKLLKVADPQEKEEINIEIKLLKYLLEEAEIENYFQVDKREKLIDIMNKNYRYIDSINDYMPLNLRYVKELREAMNENEIFDKSELINADLPHETTYTNHKIIRMVHDFYNSLPDKEIRDIFNKEFKNHRNNVRFTGFESVSSSTNYSDYKYFTISCDSNFEKTVELSHEYGHIIHDNLLNRVAFYDENNPLIEFMSQFMEALALDYISKKGSNEKRATLTRLNKILDMYNSLYTIESYYKTKNLGFETSKEIRNYYLQNYGRTALDYSYVCTAEQSHTYTISKMIIIELLKLYETDPEKTLKIAKGLCKLENCNYMKELEKRHIYLGENVEGYIKKLSRDLDKSFNIKSNH